MTENPTYEELEQTVMDLKQEVVKRKQSEEILRENEAKFRRISENIPAVVYQFKMNPDGEFSILHINEKIMDIVGVSAEDVMQDSFNFIDIMHPEDRKTFSEKVLRSAETLEPYHEIFRCLRNEEVMWVECRSTPASMADGSILWDGLFFDITELKRAEEALQESEDRFSIIFNSAQDSIFIKSKDLKYTFVNPSMERLFELSNSQIVGKSDEYLFGQEVGRHIKAIDTRVLNGEIVDEEDKKPIRGIDKIFHVIKVPMRDKTGGIIGLCGIARDVTLQKQIEEQLFQAQKMKAIGTLAGGIAHDFNNILGIMIGNAELAMDDVPEWNPAYDNLI